MIALISGIGLCLLFVLNLAYCIVNRKDNRLFPLPYLYIVGSLPVLGLMALFQSLDHEKSQSIVLSLDPRAFDSRIIPLLGTSKLDPIIDIPLLLLTLAVGFWTAYKYFLWFTHAQPIAAANRSPAAGSR